MSGTRRTVAVAIALVLATLLTPACSGLDFRRDVRLEFTNPEPFSHVDLPLEVSWTMEDFRVLQRADGSRTRDRGRYLVAVDQRVPPPGEGLDWYARDDEFCADDPDCPDEEYLTNRNVFITSDTNHLIERLPDFSGEGPNDHHSVTVVLLDGTDHRIGESAFYVDFIVNREEEEGV